MARDRPRGHRRPARSASRRRARSRTWRSTASPCPARSPPRTSCSASAGCSASSAPACSSSRPAGALGEDLAAPEREMAWMRRLVGRDRPSGHLRAHPERPRPRRRGAACSSFAAEAARRGRPVRPQVAGRPVTLLLGLQTLPPVRRTARPGRELGAAAAGRAGRGACATPSCAARCSPRRRRADPRSRSSSTRADLPARATRPTTSRRPTTASPASPRRQGATAVRGALRPAARRRRPRAAHAAAAQLHATATSTRCGRCCCTPRSAWGLGDGGAHCGTTCDASTPDVHAHALGPRPRPRPAAARVGGAEDDRTRPRRSTASATAARSQPGKSATSTSIDHDRLALHAPGDGLRPARRRPPVRAAGRRLRRHGQVGAR